MGQSARDELGGGYYLCPCFDAFHSGRNFIAVLLGSRAG